MGPKRKAAPTELPTAGFPVGTTSVQRSAAMHNGKVQDYLQATFTPPEGSSAVQVTYWVPKDEAEEKSREELRKKVVEWRPKKQRVAMNTTSDEPSEQHSRTRSGGAPDAAMEDPMAPTQLPPVPEHRWYSENDMRRRLTTIDSGDDVDYERDEKGNLTGAARTEAWAAMGDQDHGLVFCMQYHARGSRTKACSLLVALAQQLGIEDELLDHALKHATAGSRAKEAPRLRAPSWTPSIKGEAMRTRERGAKRARAERCDECGERCDERHTRPALHRGGAAERRRRAIWP